MSTKLLERKSNINHGLIEGVIKVDFLDITLSEKIIQSTIYHHFQQSCEYLQLSVMDKDRLHQVLETSVTKRFHIFSECPKSFQNPFFLHYSPVE